MVGDIMRDELRHVIRRMVVAHHIGERRARAAPDLARRRPERSAGSKPVPVAATGIPARLCLKRGSDRRACSFSLVGNCSMAMSNGPGPSSLNGSWVPPRTGRVQIDGGQSGQAPSQAGAACAGCRPSHAPPARARDRRVQAILHRQSLPRSSSDLRRPAPRDVGRDIGAGEVRCQGPNENPCRRKVIGRVGHSVQYSDAGLWPTRSRSEDCAQVRSKCQCREEIK